MDREVRKGACTGCRGAGRVVGRAAEVKLSPSTLELGGKSAHMCFEGCAWEMAMDGLQMGILFNQGQVCCAGSRVFVQESIYDRFVEEAVTRFTELEVGLTLETDTESVSQINSGKMATI